MAKILDPVRAEAKGTTRVSGRFFPAGTGQPTVTPGTNVGWTVSRTAVGTYRITFTEKYPQIVSLGSPSAQVSASADSYANYGTFTPASGSSLPTLLIYTVTGGVLVDMAANANNSVSFDVCFSTHADIR